MTTIVLTNEPNVNSISLTLESRNGNETWENQDYSWGDSAGNWAVPGLAVIEETKINSVSLTLENK